MLTSNPARHGPTSHRMVASEPMSDRLSPRSIAAPLKLSPLQGRDRRVLTATPPPRDRAEFTGFHATSPRGVEIILRLTRGTLVQFEDHYGIRVVPEHEAEMAYEARDASGCTVLDF